MRLHFFTLRRARHPVARTLLALAGLALLGFFAMFAVVIAGLVLVAFGARRLLRGVQAGAAASAPPRAPMPGVIEGEFSVVTKTNTLLPR